MIQYYKESGAIFKVIDPSEKVCLERATKRKGGTADRIKSWYKNPPVL